MISRGPEISVFRIPLDTAGETVIRQTLGYFHLWQFENADGSQNLSGVVSTAFGTLANGDDFLPMGYNSRVQFRPQVEMVSIRWADQPGVTAVFLVSSNPDALEANNIPAKQLVFQGQASGIATANIAVGTGPAVIAPFRVTRTRVVFQAPLTNTASVVIGSSSVTLTNGIQIEPGASFMAMTNAEMSAISSATGQFIRRWEELL